MGRKLPRCHPNCFHRKDGKPLVSKIMVTSHLHYQKLKKWKDFSACRFTPHTGSLSCIPNRSFSQSYNFHIISDFINTVNYSSHLFIFQALLFKFFEKYSTILVCFSYTLCAIASFNAISSSLHKGVSDFPSLISFK